jgi:small subunit ribosomal protein S18
MAYQKREQTQAQAQTRKERVCYFCLNNLSDVDYKDVHILRKFLSSFGKIVPRKRSRVCMKHQRQLANAIKRARIMALLPFVQK